MKIHLPVKLRKALLTCLESVASRHKLPRTVSTGTVLLGIASLLWSASLRADDTEPVDDEPGICEEEDILPVFDVIASEEGESDLSEGGINLCALPSINYGAAQTYSGDGVDVTGDVWYSGVATGQTYNVQGGANLKLSNSYEGSGEPSPTLTFTGEVNSLYFTADPSAAKHKGAFHFTADKWVMNAGASIKDIYIDNAEVYFGMNVDLGGANVHVWGLTAPDENVQPWEGTIRANACTVTIGGNLIVEDDALISVQTGDNGTKGIIVVEGELTGTGDLVIGTHKGGTLTLKQGGELDGQLTFKSNNAPQSSEGLGTTKLELETAAGETNTLTVHGLSTVLPDNTEISGGNIVAGGEGQGYATLILNGTETYTYQGYIGTEEAPSNGKWDEAGKLNFTVALGEEGIQTLTAQYVHVHDLTVSGGSLKVTKDGAYIQVDNSTTVLSTLTVQGQGELHTHTLAVNGGSVTVNGKLGLNDDPAASELLITGGGSVEAGFLRGQEDGHAGCLVVGAADSTGTLTLNGTSKPEDGKTLKAKSLKVQSGATEEGEGSKVTITGDVELYRGTTGDGGNIALEITGNSSVDIKGDLYGQDKGSMRGIHITTGSSLTVSGNVTMGGSAFNINAGTAEIGGTLSAGDVTVEGDGSALTVKGEATLGTLAGNGRVSGANITVAGSADANNAKVFSGTLEIGTKITLSANGNWTLGSGFNGAEATVVVQGTLKAGNVDAARAVAEGMVDLSIGAVEVGASGGIEVSTGYNLHIGALTVTGGADGAAGGSIDVNAGASLTIDSMAESSQGKLTSLTLGSGTSVTVSSGNLSIDSRWTWGEGSTLKLEKAGQTITLGGNLSITGGSADTQLTIDLTEEFLKPGGNKAGNGDVRLFASGMKDAWKGYFNFTVNGEVVGDVDNYYDLRLDAEGVLRWGIADLYWGGNAGETDLEWGTGNSFDPDEEGTGGKTAWVPGAPINFVDSNAKSHDVTLLQDVETGEFTASRSAATYNFASGTGSTIKLEVNGGITTTDGAKLSFNKDVHLSVKKDINLGEGSTLTLGADMVFGGKITGEGSVKAADGASVYALWDAGSASEVTWDEFEGHFSNALDAGVGYGISTAAQDGLTISGDATLNHSFKVESGTVTFSGGVNANNRALTVSKGCSLKLQGGISGTLSALTLGDNAVLEVMGGDGFTIETAWNWGSGSTLKLGTTVTLGSGVTLTDGNAQKLTVDLSSDFLGDGTVRGEKQLFFDFNKDWTDYFTFLVGGKNSGENYYEDLTLGTDGKLTWGRDELYWGGGANEEGLTWGTGASDEQFDTSEEGTTGKVGWEDGRDVHFVGEDTNERNVTLAGTITTGNFTATGIGAEGRAKFNFVSGQDETLTVERNMKLTNADLTFGENVTLKAARDVTMENSTLNVEGKAEFKEKVIGDGTLSAGKTGQITLAEDVSGFEGTLDTGTGGRISLSSTGETGFRGKLIGTGTLGTEKDVTLAGDLSEFTGTLDTGENGTITLSGAEGEVGASAAGNGTLEVKSGKGVTLTGQLGSGGALTVQNSGSGKLVIAGNVAAGTSWSFGSAGNVGNIVFGDAGHAVDLTGESSVSGKGTVVLANVTLPKDFEKGEAKLVVNTADTALPTSTVRTVSAEGATGGVVDVGGLEAGKLDGITVNAGGLLKGVSGVYTVSKDKAPLTLHFTETNWGNEGDGKALIEGATGDFRIDLSSGDAVNQGLQLGFKADVIEWFRTHDELYLRVLGIGTWKTDGVSIDWTKMTDTTAQILNLVVGQNYQFTADGLKLTGSTKDMYLVSGEEYGDSPNSNSPTDFSGKLATVVTNEQTLTLKWAENGTVNNLLGTEGTQLVIQDVGGKGITVRLDNTYHDPLRDDRYPENTEAKGQDTTFAGSITGGDGVDIVKSGLGKLTVGGNYTLEDGDTRIEAGALELGGDVNEMGSLTFAYGAAPGEGEQRGVFLDGGQTTIGRIEEAADAASTEGNEVNIANGAGLNLTGQSTLAHTGITGDGSGTLKLADGAGLTFTGTEGIKGVAVNLEGEKSTLELGTTQSELTNLTGKGTLKSTAGGNVSVGGGIFSGTLDGTGGGTLTVADNASVTLDNVKGTGMNVRLQGKGSTLTIDVSKKTGSSDDTLVLGSIDFGGGHLTLDYGDKGIGRNYVQATITGDGTLEFRSDGPVANGDVRTGLTVNGDLPDFKFSGVGSFLKDYTPNVDTESKELVFTMTDAVENKFEREIPGAGKNAHAGARMLWESLRDLSPTDAFFELMSNPTSDYAHLVYTLVSAIDNGQTTGLERTLTSVAGASISTLTPALAQDIHRQLTTIRNRTTGMSAEVPTDGYDEFPFWHAWIQAEGGYHKMDADGTEPGFTLHNWGGTVGVDADISRATTMGLAVTAMYGDLKPDAADSATGDLDTVYLSAFARTMRGAWSHTFVLSGGIAEAKLDRTVSYNGGNYRTRGDTDGYVVGALYEVGYTRLANKEGTVALQPIANVELRHTSLRGYTEKGSDAGVDVDDMDMTVLTLGAGARVQAAVGENAFNRSTVLEARLLAKADIGDRSGTATNAIIGHSKRAEVESAEVGAVGIETGVGISVPLGPQSGSIFADASLEWRDNWVSTNAALGYRINF